MNHDGSVWTDMLILDLSDFTKNYCFPRWEVARLRAVTNLRAGFRGTCARSLAAQSTNLKNKFCLTTRWKTKVWSISKSSSSDSKGTQPSLISSDSTELLTAHHGAPRNDCPCWKLPSRPRRGDFTVSWQTRKQSQLQRQIWRWIIKIFPVTWTFVWDSQASTTRRTERPSSKSRSLFVARMSTSFKLDPGKREPKRCQTKTTDSFLTHFALCFRA